MKDQARRVEYYAITIDDRAGEGASLARRLAQEKVNLLGVLAFPVSPGKTQVDLVPEHPENLTRAAGKLGLSFGPAKIAFLVQGADKPGAMGELMNRLGAAGINVRATLGVACGGNRFGALLWVAPSDVEAATRALGAVTMVTHHV